ncbi:zinc-ribbon domain-containing protein [Primorskyibacter marinus]|uniref:zinc-ribbon domain-containing protein n=1 Tax=Primorskyibacter marinus TaxID=1977320 RepID=UPI000E30AED5|nr:zinc-ribbon domain-containing protein [Primorskyibacter marinus]
MRLICPNCGAQYEVPAEVIPEGGRDVQCSDCGHTWFQGDATDAPVLADEMPNAPEPADNDARNDASSGDAPDEPDAAASATLSPDTWADDFEDEAEEVDKAAPPQPPRRSLDPSVADLLREEAEREARVRSAEGLESQQELGLEAAQHDDAASRRARIARERMARIRNQDAGAEIAAGTTAAGVGAAGTRNAALPDIEEINSTLRAGSDAQALETPQGTLKDSGSGFARGFFAMLLLMVVLIAIYVMAPQIKDAVPGLSDAVNAYVGQIDALRIWFAGVTQDLLAWLDGMSSEANPQ